MKDVFGKFKLEVGGKFAKTKDRVVSVADELASSDLLTDAKKHVEKGASVVAAGYEKLGAKKVIERAGDKFDEVSGKAILEEVRQLVEAQALYNDVLATKLQEALDRIAVLEAKVHKP